jgi:hypothetical protein
MSSKIVFAAALLILIAAPPGIFAQSQDASSPPANGSQQQAPATQDQKDKDQKDKKDKKSTPNSGAAKPGFSQDAEPPDAPAAPVAPAAAPKADAQDAPKAATPAKGSTAVDNPFPEDVSKQAAVEAKAADAKAAADNAPNAPATPRQPGGSSSLDGLDKLGIDDGSRKQLKLESPDGSSSVYDPKRADEDLRVGKFYLKAGDAKGAYDRFKDATDYDHENADAVYWLAEAARKLNLAKEAAQNYTVYLDAMPDGPNAKAARKALNELASTTKP